MGVYAVGFLDIIHRQQIANTIDDENRSIGLSMANGGKGEFI